MLVSKRDLSHECGANIRGTDDFVKPSPANQRAVIETVEALRRAGHECIEFSVPQGTCSLFSCQNRHLTAVAANRAIEIFIGLTAADGYKTLTADIGSDPVVRFSCVHCHPGCLQYSVLNHRNNRTRESRPFFSVLGSIVCSISPTSIEA